VAVDSRNADPVARCAGYHGGDCQGSGIPVLGEEHPAYRHAALVSYAGGKRRRVVMVQAARSAAMPGLVASDVAGSPSPPRRSFATG